MATKRVGIVLDADSRAMQAGLAAAARQVRTFAYEVGVASQSIFNRTTIAQAGVAAAAIGTVLAIKQTVGAAVAFETQMRNVNSILHVSEGSFQALSTQVLELARNVPQDAETLAAGLYDIASSGFDGAEGLTVLNEAAKAATAGMTDTATAAKGITAVLNAYGLSASDAADVSDILFQTVNLGVITFEELSSQLGDVVGTAAAAQVDIAEVGSALATMTLSGINAAEASTSLNRVLTSIIQPSEGLAFVLKQIGYESGVAALEQDGLYEVFRKIVAVTGDSAEQMVALFPEIRSLRGGLALAANDGENFRRVIEGINDEAARSGATNKAFAEQMRSVGNQMKLAVNDLKTFGIEVGRGLLPAVGLLAAGLGEVTDVLRVTSGFMADHREIVLAVGLIYAARFIPQMILAAQWLGRLRVARFVAGEFRELAAAATSAAGRMELLKAAGAIAAISVLLALKNSAEEASKAAAELAAEQQPDLILAPEEAARVKKELNDFIGQLSAVGAEKAKAASISPFSFDEGGARDAIRALESEIAAISNRPAPGWWDTIMGRDTRIDETQSRIRAIIQLQNAQAIAATGASGALDVEAFQIGEVSKALNEFGSIGRDIEAKSVGFNDAQRQRIAAYEDEIAAARFAGATTDELAEAIFQLVVHMDDRPLLALATAEEEVGTQAQAARADLEKLATQFEENKKKAQELAEAFVAAFDPLASFELPDAEQAAEDLASAREKVADAEDRLADAQEKVRENQRYLERTPERDRDLAKARRDVADAERDLAEARGEVREATEAQMSPEDALEKQYEETLRKREQFLKDFEALSGRLRPEFLLKALEDPEAYGPVLRAMVEDTDGSLVAATNAVEDQLRDLKNRILLIVPEVQAGVDQQLDTLSSAMLEGIEFALSYTAEQAAAAAQAAGAMTGQKWAEGYVAQLQSEGTQQAIKDALLAPLADVLPGGDVDTKKKGSSDTLEGIFGGATRAFGSVDAHFVNRTSIMYGERGPEAYIPLSASKRERSTTLMRQVAHMLGQDVSPMATGGIIPNRFMVSTGHYDPRGESLQMKQLMAWLRSHQFGGVTKRGGDVYVDKLMPANFSEFVQDMERKQRMGALVGDD